MTDDKKAPGEAEPFDWDQALSEWEGSSFKPEVAKEIVSHDPPRAEPPVPPPRPLYRPPTDLVQKGPPQRPPPPTTAPRPAGIRSPSPGAVSRAPLPTGAPPPGAPPSTSPSAPPTARVYDTNDDDAGGATVITTVPKELLRNIPVRPSPVPRPISKSPFPPTRPPPRSLSPPPARSRSPLPSRRVDAALEVPEVRAQQATVPAADEVVEAMEAAARAPSVAPAELEDADSDSDRTPNPVEESPYLPEPPVVPRRARPAQPPSETRAWPNEKPASGWLNEGTRAALEARAGWLEEEARATVDKVVRARGLLACSEILATVGDLGHAEELASEAQRLAPSLALAHRQARALLPSPPDPDGYIAALDAEAKAAPGAAAKLYTTLLAAEALHERGDDDGAGKRLDQAARLVPGDARAAVARAARALGKQDTSSPALRLPDSGGLAPLAEGIALALRLRGVDRKETEDQSVTPGEVLLRARRAIDRADVTDAAPQLARLASIPELAQGATWLAASLGAASPSRRAESARWFESLVDRGVQRARRSLVARGIELSDPAMVTRSLSGAEGLSAAELITIRALGMVASIADGELDAAASATDKAPLVAAVGTVVTPADREHSRIRARRTAGTPRSRASTTLGRLLAAGVEPQEIEAALAAFAPLAADAPPGLPAVALEMAHRAGNWQGVSRSLEGWGEGTRAAGDRALCALSAALVAERAGDRSRALDAFGAARKSDPLCEAALRALASLTAGAAGDLVSELNVLADDLGEGVAAAVLRLEAVARAEATLPEPTRTALLERAHRAAPAIPIASFLAERLARRGDDVESVLRWIRERQSHAADPIEAAIDAVREALLVAEREPSLAGDKLREAHAARPSDAALRALYEKMSPEAEDRAGWRERRAAESTGTARTMLYLEAAFEYERAGDDDGAVRCAEGAAATDAPLGVIARERAELRTGRVARLADELLSAAKGAVDVQPRREAYERLATLDATARHDPASALLWHRSILEESPDYKPSLRHVEQYLVGEGRDDELEPIAASIATALRGTGSGECVAHAELAARLRMRGAAGSWDASYDMVEIAAGEHDPSLWSLRMRQAHARARGDDAAFLDSTLRLVERASQPAELAALLSRAGEAAGRLGRLDDARALLERATAEDPGDVAAWATLKDARLRASDARGAAEASEALARGSQVAAHQLAAWYEAGRLWDDDVREPDRAIVALEAAAAIDVAHADVFDRLSRIYAARSMQPELAGLLERRISGISDPQARLAMEVRRGRLLLEVGDRDAARLAFQSALGERPDDPAALAAFADLCVAEGDWEAAEQALVRLARLLPTADEQRAVYARLGELYSGNLVNLARAEVALKEVLKRAPEDIDTARKLVEVYKRQNDAARAAELQQELIARSQSPEEKRARLLELAAIHENTAHDNRRAEQTLEAGRREFPQDVGLLRALAEFYVRHHQAPAVNILLDRAGADARRALAAGRFTPAAFGVLATVFDLRGKKDAAAVSEAMLSALEGRPAQLSRAGERALDPRLDDLLAPDVLTPALRALLAKTGEALDAVSPVDPRALGASTVPADAPIARLATGLAAAIGLGPIHLMSSPKLGAVCMPVGARAPAPQVVIVGQAMVSDERIAPFLMIRALKLLAAKASAFARSSPSDMAVLVSAWLKCFNPSWQPQGINPALLNTAGGKLQAALPKKLDPDVGMLALEIAGGIGTQQVTLGPSAIAWGNRVALLALGDPNVALDAIAASANPPAAPPRDPQERGAWVARTPPARDLIAFGVTDAFAEARARLGLNR